MRRPWAAAVPTAVLVTLLTACGAGVSGGPATTAPSAAATPTPTSPATPGATASPAAPERPVLVVRDCCAFGPPGAFFQAPPRLLLAPDGSVYIPGAVPAIYPGPALAPLLAAHLDPTAVAGIVSDFQAAGVTATPADLGHAGIVDDPQLVITLVTGGTTAQVSFDDYPPEQLSGLSDAQRLARRRLLDAVAAAEARVRPPATPYTPARVGVLVLDTAGPTPSAPPAVVPPGSTPGPADVRDWPLSQPALSARLCVALEGAGAATVLAAAGRANANTLWRSGGTAWSVALRPMSPYDTLDC